MSSRLVSLLHVLALASVLFGVAAPARAQTAPAGADPDARTVRARALFAEGVAAVEAQNLAGAEAAFRGALELRDAPTIRYNLALVLFKRDAFPEAVANNDAVLRDTTATAELRAQAESLRGQIAELAGYARIDLRGSAGATVALDGYGVGDLGAEVALAPGAHVATATQAGREVARAEATLVTGQHATIVLEAPALAPVTLEEPVEQDESVEAPLLQQWWFWTAIGGGVVILAVILGVVIASSGDVEPPIQGNFQPGVLQW